MQKAKNDDKLKRGDDRFNPNVAFLVIVLCFLFMMPFRLDLALESIWINEVYPSISSPAIVGLIILNAALLIRWRLSRIVLAGYVVIIAIWILVGVEHRTWISWIIGILLCSLIVFELLALCLLGILVVWQLSRRIHLKPSILKGITLFVLMGTIVTISAISMSTRKFFGWDQLAATTSNQHTVYHLMVIYDGSGGIYGQLYECNAYGIFCERLTSHLVE